MVPMLPYEGLESFILISNWEKAKQEKKISGSREKGAKCR